MSAVRRVGNFLSLTWKGSGGVLIAISAITSIRQAKDSKGCVVEYGGAGSMTTDASLADIETAITASPAKATKAKATPRPKLRAVS